MIKIKVSTKENRILGIEASGHANFAGTNEADIVCSAVSSVIQTAMLGLMQVAGVKLEYTKNDKNGYLNFNLPKKITDIQQHDAQIILNTMLCGIKDLHEGFSDFIELEVL